MINCFQCNSLISSFDNAVIHILLDWLGSPMSVSIKLHFQVDLQKALRIIFAQTGVFAAL